MSNLIGYKRIFNKCNEAYSKGEVYVLTPEEKQCIEDLLNIKLLSIEMTDAQYDFIYKRVESLYPDDRMFKMLTSINTGYGVDVDLPVPAGSLTECKIGDIDKWVDIHSEYLITEKLDGCSIILKYVNGVFKQAITRGDGYKGKDVTRHLMNNESFPKVIKDSIYSGYIRGELICPKKDIPNMIEELAKETGRTYKNGRNTIAGFLNSKETLESVNKYAEVVVYEMMEAKLSRWQQINWLMDNGFDVVNTMLIHDASQICDQFMIDEVNSMRSVSFYEIDGVVITRETMDGYTEFETGTINPIEGRKYKMISMDGESSVGVKTTINNITWNPSKDGKLIPVLNVEPVDIGGTTVSNVSGFNYDWLTENEVGIGSEVEIIRSGDVIPKVVKVLTKSTNINRPAESHVSGVHLILDDHAESQVVKVRKLVHLAQTLELDCAGYASMEKLYDMYSISPSGLFVLTEEDIKRVLGVNGSKLYASIQKALANMSEAKYADAIGVFGSGIGTRLLEGVIEAKGTLVEDVNGIEGFSEIRSAQYKKYWNSWVTEKNHFQHLGFTFQNGKRVQGGKIITPTGVRFKPDQKEKLEAAGLVISDSLSKSTSILVVKDPNSTSSKMKKAQEMGITIKTYDEIVQEFGL